MQCPHCGCKFGDKTPTALTQRQRDTLVFIVRYKALKGLSPSVDEIRVELGLKSKSGVVRLLAGLEERGAIRRMSRLPRALEVIHAD